MRDCSDASCGLSTFPRTDSAVIMLVHDGGSRCLLGRQANWPEGVYPLAYEARGATRPPPRPAAPTEPTEAPSSAGTPLEPVSFLLQVVPTPQAGGIAHLAGLHPPGTDPALAGTVAHHAFLTIDLLGSGQVAHVSNPVKVTIVP